MEQQPPSDRRSSSSPAAESSNSSPASTIVHVLASSAHSSNSSNEGEDPLKKVGNSKPTQLCPATDSQNTLPSTHNTLPSFLAAAGSSEEQRRNIAAILNASPSRDMLITMMNSVDDANNEACEVKEKVGGNSSARELVEVPTLEQVIAAVEGHDDASVVARPVLPPFTFADVMDCFRLYFGSSVTVFPFYAARLGAVGFVFVISAAISINVATQNALHRTRYNLLLAEVEERLARQRRKNTCASGNKRDSDDVTPTVDEEGMSTTAIDVDLEESTQQGGKPSNHDEGSAKRGKGKKCLEDISDVLPYFTKLGTLVKVSNQLWPDHWLKHAITVCTFTSQFFTCCSFSLLLARNLAPLIGISGDLAVYAAASAIASLTLASGPKTKTTLAYFNNLFIFGGAGLLLFASLVHEQTDEEKAMPLQILPKSISQFAIYAPSVIAYLSVQILTVDVETLLGARCMKAVHNAATNSSCDPEPPREENHGEVSVVTNCAQETVEAAKANATIYNRPAPVTPHMTPTTNGALKLLFPSTDPLNKNNGPISSAVTPAASVTTTPTISRTVSFTHISPAGSPTLVTGPTKFSPQAAGVHQQLHANELVIRTLRPEALKASLADVLLVRRYFQRALLLGAGLSVVVLLFFAELIMMCFKDNTNAIIALSLPDSPLRTAILLSLTIGLFACGALNVGPICDLLDLVSTKISTSSSSSFVNLIPSLAKRAVLRALLFSIVITFLYLVPFFDLVAGLSGAVCTPAFAFFIPSACELQSEILRATASPSLSTLMKSTSQWQRICIAWGRMPTRAKVTMVISLALGSFIFTFSTAMVIQETIRRHHEGSS